MLHIDAMIINARVFGPRSFGCGVFEQVQLRPALQLVESELEIICYEK